MPDLTPADVAKLELEFNELESDGDAVVILGAWASEEVPALIAALRKAWAERDAAQDNLEVAHCVHEAFVAETKRENAERKAIIDKLPKTADGVAVVLGEIYWYLDWVDGPPPTRARSVQPIWFRPEACEIDTYGSLIWHGSCGHAWRKGDAKTTIDDPGDLHSTPEAAEAAAKGGCDGV